MKTACADQYDAVLELIAGKRYDEAIAALEALVAACDDHAAAHADLGHGSICSFLAAAHIADHHHRL